jgi:SAM-dependent methyltransferase
VGFHPDTLLGITLLETFLFLVGVLLTQSVRNRGIRSMLPPILEMARAVSQGPNREFLADLVKDELQRTAEMVVRLPQDGYRPARPEAMASFFDRFFKQGGGTYIGIDSHVPSDYIRSYEWYLQIHQQNSPSGDTRVLVSAQNALSDDYFEYQRMWTDFYEWHEKFGVKLLWLDRDKVDKLRSMYSLQDTDIGLWKNHAVLFKLDAELNPTLTMIFRDDPDQRDQESSVSHFVADVVRDSERLEAAPPGLTVMSPQLARVWDLYVDSSQRTDPNGPFATFLLGTLAGYKYVLDAATGIACESVLLLSQDKEFSVVSNEVDVSLRAVASEYAEQHECRLDLRDYYWESLAKDIPGNMKFDAVLLLGNSLCLTTTSQRRERALTNLFSVLRSGGLLVIDERNFQYLIDHAAEIVADPYNNFPPVRDGDVLYRGTKVRAYPTSIQDDRVQWRFFSNEPRVTSSAEIERRPSLGDVMSLHAFRHGELYALLRSCGFSDTIQVFADLRPLGVLAEGDSLPDLGDASFVTYVARRP